MAKLKCLTSVEEQQRTAKSPLRNGTVIESIITQVFSSLRPVTGVTVLQLAEVSPGAGLWWYERPSLFWGERGQDVVEAGLRKFFLLWEQGRIGRRCYSRVAEM